MNSAQRRQDARKWKYQVKLTLGQADRNGYDNMFDWCCNTFGNGVRNDIWREKHLVTGTWWQFSDSKAAALFTLKWS
jgi:hypothetical protein